MFKNKRKKSKIKIEKGKMVGRKLSKSKAELHVNITEVINIQGQMNKTKTKINNKCIYKIKETNHVNQEKCLKIIERRDGTGLVQQKTDIRQTYIYLHNINKHFKILERMRQTHHFGK